MELTLRLFGWTFTWSFTAGPADDEDETTEVEGPGASAALDIAGEHRDTRFDYVWETDRKRGKAGF